MTKKKSAKEWPPEHRAIIEEPIDEEALIDELVKLHGMSRLIVTIIVTEGNWPAEASELARKYGLAEIDAEAVLEVLNRNR
mgnify:CR=1 FL=1